MAVKWYTIFALVLTLALATCGGDSSPQQPTRTVLAPAVTMTAGGTVVPFTTSGRGGTESTETITYTVSYQDYFKCVPNGHNGVMLHADMDGIKTGLYRGVGLDFGRFGSDSHTTRFMPNLVPVAIAQTWAVNAEVPDTFEPLLLPTLSHELADGTYSVTVVSSHKPEGNFIRYIIAGVYDSGDVKDINPVVDMSLQSLVFFDASGPSLCPYIIQITSPTVFWSE